MGRYDKELNKYIYVCDKCDEDVPQHAVWEGFGFELCPVCYKLFEKWVAMGYENGVQKMPCMRQESYQRHHSIRSEGLRWYSSMLNYSLRAR